MKKRTLAALAATLLFAVTTVDTFVAPHMAHAQASDATAPATAPATAAPPVLVTFPLIVPVPRSSALTLLTVFELTNNRGQ